MDSPFTAVWLENTHLNSLCKINRPTFIENSTILIVIAQYDIDLNKLSVIAFINSDFRQLINIACFIHILFNNKDLC